MATKHPFSGDRFRNALKHFVFGRAAQATGTFLLTLATVRLLGARDYGAYMVLWGLIEFGRPLTSLGLLPALQQFLPEMAVHATPSQLRALVRWTSVARFALLTVWSVAVLLAWEPLCAWVGLSPAQQLGPTRWLVCALAFVVLGSELAYEMLEALLDQRMAQYIRGAFPLLRLGGLLALYAFGLNALIPMLALDVLFSGLCLIAAELSLVRRIRQLRPNGSKTFEPREIIAFAWHMSGTQFFNAIGSPGLSRLVAAGVLGTVGAGHLAFVQQLVEQFKRFMPSMLLANLVRPMLVARRAQGDDVGVATATGVLWKFNVLGVWPAIAVTVLAGDPILGLLGGIKARGLGVAAAWLVAGSAATAQTQLVGMLMQIYRHAATLRSVSASSLAVPGLIWLGARLGVEGAAAGFAAGAWIRGALAMLVLKRLGIRMSSDPMGLVRIGVVTVAAFAAAWLPRTALGEVLAGCVFVPLYLLGIYLVKPLSFTEYTMIDKIFRGRAKVLRRFAR